MRTSTIVMAGVLSLAAMPLVLHLFGGSSGTTTNWIKTLHGGAVRAVHGGSPAPALAGQWTVTIDSEDTHLTATMTLTQDGKTVTGTFTNPSGDGTWPVAGTVVDGVMTLNVNPPADHAEMRLALKGVVNDVGSLAGQTTSAKRDATWTAVKAKDRN